MGYSGLFSFAELVSLLLVGLSFLTYTLQGKIQVGSVNKLRVQLSRTLEQPQYSASENGETLTAKVTCFSWKPFFSVHRTS